MEQQSYYIILGNGGCDRHVNDRSIAVNCAGACVLERSFITDNIRGREDFYLQYLVGGQMNVLIDGNQYEMREGDVIVYYPHTHYHYESRTGGVRYYWVHFSGSEALSVFKECGLENARIYHVGLHDRLIKGFERLFSDFISRDRFFELSLGQTVVKICLDIARLLSNTDGQKRKTDDRIDSVIAYIHRNLNREMTIEELAESVYLSEGRLRVLFRERFGMSPLKYITSLRISTAKQLLEQPDITITEVARSVGISDPLYFSRIFRAETGISPSEYKKNNDL